MPNIEEQKKEFLDICRENIKREGIDDLLKWICSSDFFTAPASTRFHGSYPGGLAEHSLNVYRCLSKIVGGYPEENISAETVAVTALFHDLCKVHCYKTGTRNVKDESTGKWVAKEVYETDEQFPIGHGEKSCIILQWFLKKLSVDELLAIRYHMGGFDASAKGGDGSISKAYTSCPLAVMLHMADLEATYLIESKNK